MSSFLTLFRDNRLAGVRNTAIIGELKMLNCKIGEHGLVLSDADCRELAEFRRDVLNECDRVETGLGAVGTIVEQFADSGYVDQRNFKQVVEDLTECFYTLKNETEGKASDDQVMEFLHYLFETAVGGDTSKMYDSQAMDDFVSAVRGDLRYRDPEDEED